MNTVLNSTLRQRTEELLTNRALHVIDDAYFSALSLMSDVESPEIFFRTDHRVLDAVLYLASVGKNSFSNPELEVTHRLSPIEWESLLIHAVGANLLIIAKEARHAD